MKIEIIKAETRVLIKSLRPGTVFGLGDGIYVVMERSPHTDRGLDTRSNIPVFVLKSPTLRPFRFDSFIDDALADKVIGTLVIVE
jgi:hypothetical protein